MIPESGSRFSEKIMLLDRPGVEKMAKEAASGERVLVIGDKAWSSWSLRPWLAAKAAGIVFDEVEIGLRRPETQAEIAIHSPSGRVPVLKDGDVTVWDSLAICEYLAEIAPEARLWPEEPQARAVARSVSAEMHSGFYALRNEFPMDFHARIAGREPSEKARADIVRVAALWRETRGRYGVGGAFLFSSFTIADAMYAPVATRFRTYGIDLGAFGDEDGAATAYAATLLAMPEMAEWGAGAKSALERDDF
jgi:glutathione S-transferase